MNPFIELVTCSKEVFYTLLIQHPCKKCLIRACCSEDCEQALIFKRWLYPFKSVTLKKAAAWLIVFDIGVVVLAIVRAVLKL